MAAPLEFKLQDQLLNSLRLLNAKYSISCDGENHFVDYNGHKNRIYVYPAMWNKRSEYLPPNSITISDKLIKYNLPQADAEIRDAIGIND